MADVSTLHLSQDIATPCIVCICVSVCAVKDITVVKFDVHVPPILEHITKPEVIKVNTLLNAMDVEQMMKFSYKRSHTSSFSFGFKVWFQHCLFHAAVITCALSIRDLASWFFLSAQNDNV